MHLNSSILHPRPRDHVSVHLRKGRANLVTAASPPSPGLLLTGTVARPQMEVEAHLTWGQGGATHTYGIFWFVAFSGDEREKRVTVAGGSPVLHNP